MSTIQKVLPSLALAFAMVSISTGALAQDDDVIVVRGTNIPDTKKATSEITTVIDEVDLERQGDSDVAASLRRMTGLSINDGKFVVVRGLNERYSSATLNGAPLPSPEPLRRAAPLDLFPTSILKGSSVQKTFSPQYSGEFGGGLVELTTKSVPKEGFFEVGVSVGLDDRTTVRDGLFYEGSNTDVFGFDDGLRDVPSELAPYYNTGITGLDAATQNLIDTSFEQSKTLLINSSETPVNGGANAAFGKVWDGANYKIGTTTFVGYDNSFQTRQGLRQRPKVATGGVFSTDEGSKIESNYKSTEQNIQVSALNSTGLELDNSSYTLTTMLLRNSSKEARLTDEENFDRAGGFPIRQENTEWVERQIWQAQLNGEHDLQGLNDLEVDWRIAYGEAERDAPYDRQTSYVNRGSGYQFFNFDPNDSFIRFSSLKDENLYAGLDFTLPLTVGGNSWDVSFGGAYTDKSRNSDRRDYYFQGSAPSEVLGSRADIVFDDAILGLNTFTVLLNTTSQFPDNSSGELQVDAAYVSVDAELGEYLRAAVGGRYESSDQSTSSSQSNAANSTVSYAPISEEYFLPAATITWIPAGNVQVRFGYSETITRPQFQELAPSIFVNRDTDTSFFGNPFLINSELKNYDARFEWYFNRGEFLTIGAFYKDITNPIEEYIAGGEAIRTSFLNAPSAEIYGAEFEFEKDFDLGEIMKNSGLYGRNLVFKTNYTYSKSEVSSAGTVILNQGGVPITRDAAGVITDGRPLQGQSEHLFNLQLGYEDEERGLQATALLNYASERVLFAEAPVGASVLPAVVETPPVTLDFVVNQKLSVFDKDLALKVKFGNILGDNYEAVRNDGVSEFKYETYDLGRTVSVGLTQSF